MNTETKRTSNWIAVVAALLLTTQVGADWPQYRGVERDGIDRSSSLAASWPEDGPPVEWRLPIGGAFSQLTVRGNAHPQFVLAPAAGHFGIMLMGRAVTRDRPHTFIEPPVPDQARLRVLLQRWQLSAPGQRRQGTSGSAGSGRPQAEHLAVGQGEIKIARSRRHAIPHRRAG